VVGQALALVPLAVGLVFGALVLPRSVAPDEIPGPVIDGERLSRVFADDDARAARVAKAPLPSPVRNMGSAFRAFNAAEAAHADEGTLAQAKNDIVAAVRQVSDADIEALLDLRAFQAQAFVTEVRRFEKTGEVSDELKQLGGTFIESMQKVGWCDGRRVVMPESALRVAFKLTWNHMLLLDRLAPTLDEQRVLYAFYLAHPHVGEADRARVATALASAHDRAAIERATQLRDKATAGWLLGKIGELSAIDSGYPAELARAAALFMKHDYRGSAALYEAWIDLHPGGPWSLRARNHLRAALLAAEKAFQ
jgi:hypothetical protein